MYKDNLHHRDWVFYMNTSSVNEQDPMEDEDEKRGIKSVDLYKQKLAQKQKEKK